MQFKSKSLDPSQIIASNITQITYDILLVDVSHPNFYRIREMQLKTSPLSVGHSGGSRTSIRGPGNPRQSTPFRKTILFFPRIRSGNVLTKNRSTRTRHASP